MYTIGKPAEFDSGRVPLRGQCQPHTKGWRLRCFSRGQEEVLYEDNYYTCRELQKACAGLPLAEAKQKIAEMADSLSVDLQETQKLNSAVEETVPPGSLPPTDETPVDLPTVKPSDEDTDSTQVIPQEEMERHARREEEQRGE